MMHMLKRKGRDLRQQPPTGSEALAHDAFLLALSRAVDAVADLVIDCLLCLWISATNMFMLFNS